MYLFPVGSGRLQLYAARKGVHMRVGRSAGVGGEIWDGCFSRSFPSGQDQRLVLGQSQSVLVNRKAVKTIQGFLFAATR